MNGLVYLKSIGINHRDIDRSNILLSWNENNQIQCKISDYGLILTPQFRETFSKRQIPTPDYYVNQELIFEMDLWSLGILIYELFSDNARPSASSEEEEEMSEKILTCINNCIEMCRQDNPEFKSSITVNFNENSGKMLKNFY